MVEQECYEIFIDGRIYVEGIQYNHDLFLYNFRPLCHFSLTQQFVVLIFSQSILSKQYSNYQLKKI